MYRNWFIVECIFFHTPLKTEVTELGSSSDTYKRLGQDPSEYFSPYKSECNARVSVCSCSLHWPGFHRTFSTGAACQQRTLTPPDTWSCPTLGLASVLMLRPISPELVLFLDFWVSNIPRYFCFCLSSLSFRYYSTRRDKIVSTMGQTSRIRSVLSWTGISYFGRYIVLFDFKLFVGLKRKSKTMTLIRTFTIKTLTSGPRSPGRVVQFNICRLLYHGIYVIVCSICLILYYRFELLY